MAKLNEGDVMEGIFAICLADIFAHNSINKGNVNKIRREIDPELFRDGSFSKEVWRVKDGSPKDNIGVTLNMRLKYNSTFEAFGANYEPLYESSNDIGNLDKKINTLVSYVNTHYASKVRRVKDTYLKNNQADEVNIVINADGIAGESSGGNIKGDLMVTVFINGLRQMDTEMVFSLKSGSKTLANLSPYNGMKDVIGRFGVQLDSADDVKFTNYLGDQLKQAKTPHEKKLKVKLINEMYGKMLKGIKSQPKTGPFVAATFKLFRDVTFGEDLADVVDIDKTKIKEMIPEYIDQLEQETTSIKTVMKPANGKGSNVTLKFHMMPSDKELFQLRFKQRVDGLGDDFKIKELKFYVEAGAGAYAPKLK